MISSYQPERELLGLESELARLRSQALLSWTEEARLLTALGLRDGMRLLDVGSGPGFVAEQLGALLPSSPMALLDVSLPMLQRARATLKPLYGRRVSYVMAGATATGLADNGFDFALARYVFQHLPDPPAAARELGRVLRPGGTLVIVDVDARLWGIAEPQYAYLQRLYAKAGLAQAQSSADRLIGRRLWRILTEAGFDQVLLQAFVYHSEALGLEPFLPQLTPDRLRPLVAAGHITSEELAQAQVWYQRFIEAPDAYVLLVGLMASGIKRAP